MKKKETLLEIIERESAYCPSKPYEYYELKGAEFSGSWRPAARS